MSDRNLPWDVARCNGTGCHSREMCLRHEQIRNMGPRTPMFEHCMTSDPVTYPCYIPIKESRDEIDWASRPSTLVVKDGGTYLRGIKDLERFAALVAAAEREECEKVCEEHWRNNGNAMECADAIRARGQK